MKKASIFFAVLTFLSASIGVCLKVFAADGSAGNIYLLTSVVFSAMTMILFFLRIRNQDTANR